MAEFSNYMENKIIDIMRNITFTGVTTYVALFKSPVTDAELEAGNITNEVSGGGYARQLAGLSAPQNGESANSADITFPTATAAWGTITHCALMDAASGGNVLMYSALDNPRTVEAGDIFRIPAGQLKVQVT